MRFQVNGDVRYFSIWEAARLQGMSDTFLPAGSHSQAMRQLGNAMPVLLSPCPMSRRMAQVTTPARLLQ
jgi:DNA (cytosine-5)-methyltransferase 1